MAKYHSDWNNDDTWPGEAESPQKVHELLSETRAYYSRQDVENARLCADEARRYVHGIMKDPKLLRRTCRKFYEAQLVGELWVADMSSLHGMANMSHDIRQAQKYFQQEEGCCVFIEGTILRELVTSRSTPKIEALLRAVRIRIIDCHERREHMRDV